MGNARSTSTSEQYNESIGVVVGYNNSPGGSPKRNGNRKKTNSGSSPPRGVNCSFDVAGESSDSEEVEDSSSNLFAVDEEFVEFEEVTSFDNGVGLMFDLFDDEDESSDDEQFDLDYEEWEEARASALNDLKQLKAHARYHLHPEDKVVTNGNCGRCYFDRGSAEVEWEEEILGVVNVESVDEMCARDEALEELGELKERAKWHLHPEISVTTNGNTSRCYFDRGSAEVEWNDEVKGVIETEMVQDMNAKNEALADIAALRLHAKWHLHPEIPVTTNGNTSRCYFDRASKEVEWNDEIKGVIETETVQEMNARDEALAELSELKLRTSWYYHPERKVVTNGEQARCYFDRGSAEVEWNEEIKGVVEVQTKEDLKAMNDVLDDLKALKERAVFHLHPELPVTGTGNTARCYFNRGSAPAHFVDGQVNNNLEHYKQMLEAELVREDCLKDLAALKERAIWHLHPEIPVTTNGNTARCYFDRGSADVEWNDEIKGVIEVETAEDMEVKEDCLNDLEALKTHARYHLHPEVPVTTNGNTARCYFERASAPEVESLEDANARAEALADLLSLKERARWHLHPEDPVTTNGNTARCYFERASAPEVESLEDANARAEALADLLSLKERARWHLHPEDPVISNGYTNSARCFFERASAPERESEEEAAARTEALADLAEQKTMSQYFMHPEVPVTTNGVQSRNFFHRYAANVDVKPSIVLQPEEVVKWEVQTRIRLQSDASDIDSFRERAMSDQFEMEGFEKKPYIKPTALVTTAETLDEGDSDIASKHHPEAGYSPQSVFMFGM